MAFVTDLSALFTAIYTNVAAQRSTLTLPPLVPNNLPIIGGEQAPVAQIAPRIVIVPTRNEYDFSQQMPMNQDPRSMGRAPYKSILRRWMYFEAQLWGDPDTTARPTTGSTIAPHLPDPVIGFNTSVELERQFLIAFTTAAGSPTNQSWTPMGSEWTVANLQNNRYGRLLVLTFRVATPVTETPFTTLPYSRTQGDGGVTGTINVEAASPAAPACTEIPELVATFVVPPPDPDFP